MFKNASTSIVELIMPFIISTHKYKCVCVAHTCMQLWFCLIGTNKRDIFHLLNKWIIKRQKKSLFLWLMFIRARTKTQAPASRPVFFLLDSCVCWTGALICMFLLTRLVPLSSQGSLSWFGKLPRYLSSYLLLHMPPSREINLDRQTTPDGRGYMSSSCISKPSIS